MRVALREHVQRQCRGRDHGGDVSVVGESGDEHSVHAGVCVLLCAVDGGLLGQPKPVGVDPGIEEQGWCGVLECPQQLHLIGRIGQMISAAVFDVDPGDAHFPQLRGEFVGLRTESGLDIDGDRHRKPRQFGGKVERFAQRRRRCVRQASGCGHTEAGRTDSGKAGLNQCSRGRAVPRVRQDQGCITMMEPVEGQLTGHQGERVRTTGACVDPDAEGEPGQVDENRLTGWVHPTGRGDRRIGSRNERCGDGVGLDEQSDPGSGLLVTLSAARGQHTLQRLVRGVGDRDMRVVALGHRCDVWCDIAWQPQGLGQDFSRVALVRPQPFEIDTLQLRYGKSTPTDMVGALTESGNAATQPRNALRCGGSLGYSVCGVSQPCNGRFAHADEYRSRVVRPAPNNRASNNGTVTPEAKSSMPNLAQVAKALADERRAQLVLTLIDGRAWTPTELATHHRWPRSSTTEHLNVLIDTGIIGETRQGKHRYVRLSDAEVAETIERLAALGSTSTSADHSLRGQHRNRRLRAARTCYAHLAGQLGVQLRAGLVSTGVVSAANGYTLSPRGPSWFDDLGYPLRSRGAADRRAMVRPCLDWTERVDHLGGIVADTLCYALTDLGWIIPSNSDRAVRISLAGKTGLIRLGLL